MIKNKNIICFAPSDFWAMNPSCTTHIMKSFAAQNRILYINPFSSDLLGSVAKKKKGLWTRICRKLKSMLKFIRKPLHNFYVISPVFIPIQGKTALDWLNNIAIKFQLKLLCFFLGFSKPILWLENMRAADFVRSFHASLTVYHVSDLFAIDSYTANRKKQSDRENFISQTSDLVICVSRELFNRKNAQRGNVHYQPHGVDFELFRKAAEQNDWPDCLKNVKPPIAGYFGTMTSYNDIELLLHCARNLPRVSFVFAGQITGGDYSALAAMDNVHLLGRLPYEDIPQLCASFDVCMLQWKMGEWIRCCNPLKMLEYMASGKPIVSVPIEEAIQYSDIISIAQNKEQFCDLVKWELENDTPQRAQKRIEIARKHSWDASVENISSLIEQTMHKKNNKTAKKEHLHEFA
jgi:glycosyltransferase involved in cell wall biosynthesis